MQGESGDRVSGRNSDCNAGRRDWWEETRRKAEKVAARVEGGPKAKCHWKYTSWAGVWLLHPGHALSRAGSSPGGQWPWSADHG